MAVHIKTSGAAPRLDQPTLDKKTGRARPALSRGKANKPRSRSAPKKRGRPLKYDWTIYERLLAEVAKGRFVTEILSDDPGTYPSYGTWQAAKAADPKLRAAYDDAVEQHCDRMLARVAHIAEEVKPGDVIVSKAGKTTSSYHRDRQAQARDHASNLKWIMERIDPKNRFAAKGAQQVTHGGRLDGDTVLIAVTGGLPDVPLGELATDAEKDAVIREARKTRHITRNQIDYPHGNPVEENERLLAEEERLGIGVFGYDEDNALNKFDKRPGEL